MRIARFRPSASDPGAAGATGVVIGDEIVDLGAAAPHLPGSPVAVLAAGPEAVEAAETAAAAATTRLALAEVTLLAPVPTPRTFMAIGLNYADHLAETGAARPEHPVFFNKQVGCVVGPTDPIVAPDASTLLDYEGELGFVIGTRAHQVPKERAHEVIAGYLVVNDVTTRDWQLQSPTMTLGKSFDTHGPTGPWLVTPDEIDPHDLRIQTWVNGEQRQDGTTADMIYDCFDQVVTLSTVFTLEPGDLVSTGTPAGVGIARKPMAMLAPGDTVAIEIEGIGRIENPVVAEPAGAAFIGDEVL
jgi:2-keto-4-pentenoate hydratase/2-oxohepta-3-ene-1,7-dioic acid hydratase in catechol pathway